MNVRKSRHRQRLCFVGLVSAAIFFSPLDGTVILVPSIEIVKPDQLALNVRSYLGFAGALSVYSTDSTVYVEGDPKAIIRLLDYTTLDTEILVLNGEVYIMRDGQWTN